MKRVYAFLASLVFLGLAAIWWVGLCQFHELTWDTPLETSVFGYTTGLSHVGIIVLLMAGVFVCLYYALREE